jgi:hypothetical protein
MTIKSLKEKATAGELVLIERVIELTRPEVVEDLKNHLSRGLAAHLERVETNRGRSIMIEADRLEKLVKEFK